MSYTKTERNSRYVYDRWTGSGFCPSSTQNGQTTSRTLLSWSDVTSGTANPDRRRQIARGDNASTDYSKTYHEVSIPGVQCQVFWTQQDLTCPGRKRGLEDRTWNYGGLVLETADPSLISLTEADNIARQNAFKSIRRIQHAFQGGVWVGELGETLRMIKGNSRSIYRRVLDYATKAKKPLRKPRRTTLERWTKDRVKRASDTWLETSFGFMPALADVRNAGDALEKRFNQFEESYPFKGSGTYETVVTTHGYSSKTDRIKVRFEKHRVTQARVTYYGRVGAGWQGPRALFEARIWGFDPSSWIPTAWELIPYSWLVDYFSNAGDVVSSWATVTNDVRWTTRSNKQQYATHCTGVRYALQDVKNAMGSAYSLFNPAPLVILLGKNRVAKTVKGRNRAVVLHPPRLQFEIPGTSMKWLNMGALLAARTLS